MIREKLVCEVTVLAEQLHCAEPICALVTLVCVPVFWEIGVVLLSTCTDRDVQVLHCDKHCCYRYRPATRIESVPCL